MEWDEIWKIVLGIITSVGGIGAVILTIIKFSSNIIANNLEKKYELKLNKELEKYRSNLDNKIYISKTKFDTEFEIYRELSKTFFEMVKDIGIMIPTGFALYPSNEEDRKEYENKLYSVALKSTIAAQDVLKSNIPFIPNDLYEKYSDILNLCGVQLRKFERRWNMYYIALQGQKEDLSMEDYERSEEIELKFKELNEKIREYLSNLDILE